ncbi:MAG: phosphatase [Lachnospirales bacterium]
MNFVLDVHTHTVASGHAYSTVTENALYAKKIGLKLIGISDHAPKMPGSAGYLNFLNLKVLPEYIEGVRVLKGIELNIMDSTGKVDMKNNILKRLDYAIASLHIPCIDPMEADECTKTLINVVKNPYVNIIGHPGDPRYPLNVREFVKNARDYNTLIEINNSSFAKGNSRQGGESIVLEILEECKREATPVILGSDAHFHSYIGGFENILPLLKETDFPEELIINTDTKAFMDFLALKKSKIN